MVSEELNRLIQACLKQDKKAQKQLYITFYTFSMSICVRYTGNRYEAAEVMNQGFFKIFTKLEQYDLLKSPFAAWVGRIMINTAINYYRSNLKTDNAVELDKVVLTSDDYMPDRNLKYNDLLTMVRSLPPMYRKVFNLYAIEGYSHEEIGSLLGIGPGTSKSNLFKARKKLKIMLRKTEKIFAPVSGNSQEDKSTISKPAENKKKEVNQIQTANSYSFGRPMLFKYQRGPNF